MSNLSIASKSYNKQQQTPYKMYNSEEIGIWNSLSTNEKLLRLNNETDKYYSKEFIHSISCEDNLKKFKVGKYPQSTLQENYDVNSISYLHQNPYQLEKEKLEKIIKIDNEKINQSRKIDEISYTIDKAKVEKRLLLDEYQEKAKKIDNMSSNEEILQDIDINNIKKEKQQLNILLNKALNDQVIDSYNSKTASLYYTNQHSAQLQSKQISQLTSIDTIAQEQLNQTEKISDLEDEKLLKHNYQREKLNKLEEERNVALLKKHEKMKILKSNLEIENQIKLKNNELLEVIVSDYEKSVAIDKYAINKEISQLRQDDTKRKLDFEKDSYSSTKYKSMLNNNNQSLNMV